MQVSTKKRCCCKKTIMRAPLCSYFHTFNLPELDVPAFNVRYVASLKKKTEPKVASHLFNCCCVFACVWVSEWIAPREEKKHTSQFLFESVCALCDYWFALCILYLLGVLGEVMVSPLGARECAFFSHLTPHFAACQPTHTGSAKPLSSIFLVLRAQPSHFLAFYPSLWSERAAFCAAFIQ